MYRTLKKNYGETTISLETIEEIADPRIIKLKYYQTRNKNSKKHEKQYGVGVIKTEVRKNELNEEKQEFNNIFEQKTQADDLLKMLLKNKVTPIDLRYVLEDLVLQ